MLKEILSIPKNMVVTFVNLALAAKLFSEAMIIQSFIEDASAKKKMDGLSEDEFAQLQLRIEENKKASKRVYNLVLMAGVVLLFFALVLYLFIALLSLLF